jgi:hypothetical protein
MLAYSFQEKNPPYLLLFEGILQAAPNFAYSFIKFKEKFQSTCLLES